MSCKLGLRPGAGCGMILGNTHGSMEGERKMNDETANAIVNRHMARLLGDLEDANCPPVYHRIVKSALVWLRDDISEHEMETTDAMVPPLHR